MTSLSFAVISEGVSTKNLDSFVDTIRKVTGSITLSHVCAMGRNGLYVKPSESSLIPQIIQAILDRGVSLYMNDGSAVTFPMYSYYSKELKERRRLEALLHMLHSGNKSLVCSFFDLSLEAWTLPEAKTVMKQLAELQDRDKPDWTSKLFREESRLRNLIRYETDPVKKDRLIAEFIALQEQITFKYGNIDESRGDKTKPVIPANEECVICYEREADTMVLPCEHVVVCKQCSAKLKGTANERLCVYCRRTIDYVLE